MTLDVEHARRVVRRAVSFDPPAGCLFGDVLHRQRPTISNYCYSVILQFLGEEAVVVIRRVEGWQTVVWQQVVKVLRI